MAFELIFIRKSAYDKNFAKQFIFNFSFKVTFKLQNLYKYQTAFSFLKKLIISIIIISYLTTIFFIVIRSLF